MAGAAGAVVLKVYCPPQDGGGNAPEEAEIRRHRLPAPVDFAAVDRCLREAYGAGWVPTYLGAEGTPRALTAEAFGDFLAQAAKGGATALRVALQRAEEAAPAPSPAVLQGRQLAHESQWQVWVSAGRWCDYREPQLSQLRGAHAAGERFVALNYKSDDGKEWSYEVDLLALRQRNVVNGVSRSIRMLPPVTDSDGTCPETWVSRESALMTKARIGALCTIWLPVLGQGSSRAVVLECRSTGTALRARGGGCVDAWGCVGPRATFLAQAVALPQEFGGRQALLLRSASAEGGFLRCDPATGTVRCWGAEPGEDCLFEVVPCHPAMSVARRLAGQGASAAGCALRSLVAGQLLAFSEAGEAVLAETAPEGQEQDGELFILRYQPLYDEAWQGDGQFAGKRLWTPGSDQGFYSFAEFVAFTRKTNFAFQPFGEEGLVAAKLMWACSVEEGSGPQGAERAAHFQKTLREKKTFSGSGPNRTLYTFAQVLSFVEARGLRCQGKTDLETALFRWM